MVQVQVPGSEQARGQVPGWAQEPEAGWEPAAGAVAEWVPAAQRAWGPEPAAALLPPGAVWERVPEQPPPAGAVPERAPPAGAAPADGSRAAATAALHRPAPSAS